MRALAADMGGAPETVDPTPRPDEAAMKRALAARAGETFVLGSSEKIGAVSRYRVLPLDEVAGVIVDGADAASAPSLDALSDRGVRLLPAV